MKSLVAQEDMGIIGDRRERPIANPLEDEVTLPYNHTTGIGPFTCLSEVSGVTCTVGSGRGFAISSSGITPVG
jgi:hypothetical protein